MQGDQRVTLYCPLYTVCARNFSVADPTVIHAAKTRAIEVRSRMQPTGDMLVKQNASVIGGSVTTANNHSNTMQQNNRDGLSMSNNLQRSMNFASRRR